MALTKVTYSMILGAPKNVKDFGATGDGTTDDTAAIRLALIGGGAIYFPSGTYLVKDATDTADGVVLAPASNSVLFGEGDLSILKLGAHSTIKHNIFRLDNKSNITICELKLDGNKAQQTGTFGGFPDEYSHAIRIVDGSQNITVENNTIVDAKGDGVYVGYEATPAAITAKTYVNNNLIFGNSRQQISVVHGIEHTISNNRVVGVIDIECDLTAGTRTSAVKILGNTGVVEDFSLTRNMASDLLINLYTPNGIGYKLCDIVVDGNTCYQIACQYGTNITITNNTIVSSTVIQTQLVYLRGSQNVNVTSNAFVTDTSVSPALVCCYEEYYCLNTNITGNTALNQSTPFAKVTLGTFTESDGSTITSNASKINIKDNAISNQSTFVASTNFGGGIGTQNTAMFKLEIAGAATPAFTLTQFNGQPITVTASNNGASELRLTSNRTDAFYEFLPICNTTAATGVTDFDKNCSIRQIFNPTSNSYTAFAIYTAAVNVQPSTAFNLTADNGTFFFKIYY
jgi:hypothetical protein